MKYIKICLIILIYGINISFADDKTIIDEWYEIKIPAPPALNEVSIDTSQLLS